MSSIGITSSSLSYSVFQALTSGGQPSAGASGSATAASTDPLLATTPSSATSPADALLSATSATPQSPAPSQPQGGHHHRHGHGGGAFKQIEDAVTTALQSAQANPSTDPNTLIENAIAGVLNSAQGGAGQTSAGLPASGDSTAALTVNDSAGGGGILGSNSAASNDASSGQTFDQLLQSFGVTPLQFRTDFLNSIKDAQGGQVNIGTALQSIPSGSVVNALA